MYTFWGGTHLKKFMMTKMKKTNKKEVIYHENSHRQRRHHQKNTSLARVGANHTPQNAPPLKKFRKV